MKKKINIISNIIKFIERNQLSIKINELNNLSENEIIKRISKLLKKYNKELKRLENKYSSESKKHQDLKEKLNKQITDQMLDPSIYEISDISEFLMDFQTRKSFFNNIILNNSMDHIYDDDLIKRALAEYDENKVTEFISVLRHIIQSIRNVIQKSENPIKITDELIINAGLLDLGKILDESSIDVICWKLQVEHKKDTEFYKSLPDVMKQRFIKDPCQTQLEIGRKNYDIKNTGEISDLYSDGIKNIINKIGETFKSMLKLQGRLILITERINRITNVDEANKWALYYEALLNDLKEEFPAHEYELGDINYYLMVVNGIKIVQDRINTYKKEIDELTTLNSLIQERLRINMCKSQIAYLDSKGFEATSEYIDAIITTEKWRMGQIKTFKKYIGILRDLAKKINNVKFSSKRKQELLIVYKQDVELFYRELLINKAFYITNFKYSRNRDSSTYNVTREGIEDPTSIYDYMPNAWKKQYIFEFPSNIIPEFAGFHTERQTESYLTSLTLTQSQLLEKLFTTRLVGTDKVQEIEFGITDEELEILEQQQREIIDILEKMKEYKKRERIEIESIASTQISDYNSSLYDTLSKKYGITDNDDPYKLLDLIEYKKKLIETEQETLGDLNGELQNTSCDYEIIEYSRILEGFTEVGETRIIRGLMV